MKHGIYLEAYAPLMSHFVHELLAEELLQEVAQKHQKTAGQVALKYLYDRDIIIIPKSSNPKRIEENLAIDDFSLDDDDVAKLAKLQKARKYFPDPDNFNF